MRKVVVIPSYEPTNKLIDIVSELSKNKLDIIIVNDGSNKKYDCIFNKCSDMATVLKYDNNRGKGYALKYAFKYIKDNYKNCNIVTMDSDGQHTIKDTLMLFDTIQDNKISLGKRLRDKKIPFKSKLGNSLTRILYKLSTGVSVYDTQTGLRGFNYNMLDFLLNINGDRFEYEMNVLLRAPKCNIELEEYVIETIYEDNNSGTHFRAINDSILIYNQLIKYGLSSFLSFIVDYILFIIFGLIFNVIYSNLIARVFSSLFNYFMNKNIVFEDDKNVSNSIIKYYLLVLFVIICNTLLLSLLINIGFNKYISKIFVEFILFIFNYSIQSIFVFKRNN